MSKNQKLKNKAFSHKKKKLKELQVAANIYMKRMRKHLEKKATTDRALQEKLSVKTYRKRNKITGEWEIFIIS
jgi:hypothetical protein